ncbi:glycosyltransferase family 2 protein [Marinilabiliaceae bacterium ANBcel2]|nr:glycosyltransferase family 2 protein [Marinilabiliaceae bacterium ANBcel2]
MELFWNIFSALIFGMLVLRFFVVLFNFISGVHLPKIAVHSYPKVSVLIPVRNEEENLPKLLSDLQKIDYPNLEIIVCNDNSTDNTLGVLESFKPFLSNLVYFTNKELPGGWMGKNYACHELSQRASGSYFLFVDADVRLKPEAIKKAVAFAQKKKKGLLSIFPQQIIETSGELMTVPLMNWVLLSFLPLKSVQLRWFSSLSAANGQFMLFNAVLYLKYQWHKKVKHVAVEDIEIARLMKKEKLRIAVFTGNNDVSCRMYKSGRDAIQGFSRNIHHYFRRRRLWMLLFTALVWLRFIIFSLLGHWWFLFIGIILVLMIKVLVSIMSHQSALKNLAWHIPQLWGLTKVVFKNIVNGNKIEWKGRVYETSHVELFNRQEHG